MNKDFRKQETSGRREALNNCTLRRKTRLKLSRLEESKK